MDIEETGITFDDGDPISWVGIAPEPIRGSIYYLKFCCRLAIGFTTDLDHTLGLALKDELLRVEEGTVDDWCKVTRRFEADVIRGADSTFVRWFSESPGLKAHIRALQDGRGDDLALRLVDTEVARESTGRSRQDLYRLRREGSLSHHMRNGRAMWDFIELGALPPKRLKREKSFQKGVDTG